MTLSIERADRRMGLASDRTVYSSKRNRPLLLYGRLLDDSRPSHGLTATNPDYFVLADNSEVDPPLRTEGVVIMLWPITDHSSAARVPDNDHPAL